MGKNCAELTSFQILQGGNQFMSEVEWHLLVDGLWFSWLKLHQNCFNNHGLKLEPNKQNGLQGLQLLEFGVRPLPKWAALSFHCPSVPKRRWSQRIMLYPFRIPWWIPTSDPSCTPNTHGWMWIPKIAVRGSDARVLGRGCSGGKNGGDSEGDVRSPQSMGRRFWGLRLPRAHNMFAFGVSMSYTIHV